MIKEPMQLQCWLVALTFLVATVAKRLSMLMNLKLFAPLSVVKAKFYPRPLR